MYLFIIRIDALLFFLLTRHWSLIIHKVYKNVNGIIFTKLIYQMLNVHKDRMMIYNIYEVIIFTHYIGTIITLSMNNYTHFCCISFGSYKGLHLWSLYMRSHIMKGDYVLVFVKHTLLACEDNITNSNYQHLGRMIINIIKKGHKRFQRNYKCLLMGHYHLQKKICMVFWKTWLKWTFKCYCYVIIFTLCLKTSKETSFGLQTLVN